MRKILCFYSVIKRKRKQNLEQRQKYLMSLHNDYVSQFIDLGSTHRIT